MTSTSRKKKPSTKDIKTLTNRIKSLRDNYEIPYAISSLRLFEFIFDEIDDNQETIKTNKEIERDIFKAYVLLNKMTITERDTISSQIRVQNNLSLTAGQALLQISFHNNQSYPILYSL